MNRYYLAIAVIGLLGYTAIVAAEKGEEKRNTVKPKPVVVVNAPTVKAKQKGQWNVDVTGVVTVDNAADNPIPVVTDPYPREVIQFQTGLSDQTGSFVIVKLGSVPDNKRLVIEDLSWSVSLRSQDPSAKLAFSCSLFIVGPTQDLTVFLPSISNPVPIRRDGQFEYEIKYRAFQQMRAYGFPGDDVSIGCERSADNASDLWGVSGSLIAYTIPIDSPSLSP